MINNGKAQYLAEAASEIALYTVHHNEPGFEPESLNNVALNLTDDENSAQFSFSIDAKTSQIPIVEDYIRKIVEDGSGGTEITKEDLFASLEINESITIPLESDQFEVEYYFPIAQDAPQSDLDILLWKIFGQNEGGTDSMSEFLPAAALDQINNPNSTAGTRADRPASFGTVPDGWNGGFFFKFSDGAEIEDTDINTEREQIKISTFLPIHDNNTLVIKNAVNPGLINTSLLDISIFEASTIKYRICTPNCDNPNTNTDEGLVPEFTKIKSSGKIGNIEKQLFTSVNREGFLPIFDFSIYRTVN
jgi:hypothetical protein